MHSNKPEQAQQRITRTGGLVRGVPLPGDSRLWGTHQKPPMRRPSRRLSQALHSNARGEGEDIKRAKGGSDWV